MRVVGGGGPTGHGSCGLHQPTAARGPPRPWRWGGRKWRGHHTLLAAATAAVAVIALLLVTMIGPGRQHVAAVPPKPKTLEAKSNTMEVDGAALRGRPVEVVRRNLQHLGLKVLLRWRPSYLLPPGQVLSVRPAGRVAAGTTIVIVGALRPEGTSQGPRAPGSRGKAEPTSKARHGDAHRSSRPQPPAPTPTAQPTPTGSPAPTGSPTPAPSPSTTVTQPALAASAALARLWLTCPPHQATPDGSHRPHGRPLCGSPTGYKPSGYPRVAPLRSTPNSGPAPAVTAGSRPDTCGRSCSA